MNQTLLSGLTATTLLMTTLGLAPLSYANPTRATDNVLEADVPASNLPNGVASTSSSAPSAQAAEPQPEASQISEAVKVGEYQAQETVNANSTVASIYSHELSGRQAVTLYVRNIPVLTFLGETRTPSQEGIDHLASNPAPSGEVKIASVQDQPETVPELAQSSSEGTSTADKTSRSVTPEETNNPVWRATTIAARLNQLYRDNIDASTITATWDDQKEQYIIKAGDDELVTVNADTILPDSTSNPAEDALQAVNRIRRQIGNAPPLDEIPGAPQARATQISLGPIQFSITGLASWYGPGFNGSPSASGEIFNQNALTAAHPSLPFGTQVRVTNIDTGLSVVVRINDRGPFSADRIIDLSAGAAQVIGLMQSGVAPVNLQVMGTATASSSQSN